MTGEKLYKQKRSFLLQNKRGNNICTLIDNRNQQTIQKQLIDNIFPIGINQFTNNMNKPIQRMCYSITGGDHETGDEDMCSYFTSEIIDTKFQQEGILQIESDETDRDEEDDEILARTQILNPVIGQVDHIVPRSLGGGGLESNSRVISADKNQARGNNYYSYNTNHPIQEVVIVYDGNEYDSTCNLLYANDGQTNEIDQLYNLWNDPWNDGCLIDNREQYYKENELSDENSDKASEAEEDDDY